MDLSAYKQTLSANSSIVISNITVTGNTTTVNTVDLLIQDNKVILNSGAPYPLLNASLVVNRGNSVDTSIIWNENVGKWQQTRDGVTYVDIPTNTGELPEDPNNLYFTNDRANAAIASYLPVIKVPFTYSSASPAIISKIVPADSTVSKVEIIISTQFNSSNSSISVGTIANTTELVDITDTKPSEIGIYTTFPGITYVSDTHMVLTINPGNSNTGSGILIIYY